MTFWNRWMKEREKAPLDSLAELMSSKWDEIRAWVHDICYDDDSSSSPPPIQKGSCHGQDEPVTTQEPVQQACYEELDQAVSEPPSAPSERVSEATAIPSTIPLPGAFHQNPKRREHIEVDVEVVRPACAAPGGDDSSGNEIKPTIAMEPQHGNSGPSVAGVYGQVGVASQCTPMLRQGEKVEVWSRSMHEWFEGVVLESFTAETIENGFTIPSGTYKVTYSEGTIKWIRPEQVQQLLRPRSRLSGI
jgi:hypothetical protein